MKRLGLAIAVTAMVTGTLPVFTATVPPVAATPATDGNPDLPSSCGIDVTLVLDNSGSIDASEAQLVRNGAQAFADALSGTPSRLKTVYFANTSRGVTSSGTTTANLSSIAFRDPSLYTAPTSGAGNGGTNWDDGLEAVRRSPGGGGDVVVFLTDGDPTFRNTTTPDGHQNDGSEAISGTGNTTSAADLSQAVSEANAIKASGSHMFGIGVGISGATSEQRLNDVTGDEEMTITAGVPTPTFSQADYIVAPNFTALQSVIRAFVRELCGDSLNVTKYEQKADGTTAKATAASTWTFTNTLTPAPDVWNNPSTGTGASASLSTDSSGGVSFTWDEAQDPDSHVADLVETPKSGWVYNGARCYENDLQGGDPTLLFDTVGANAAGASGNPADLLDLSVLSNRAVSCEVYNRQLRLASISVSKQTVPAGLAGDFGFTLKQGSTTVGSLSGVSHGESATFTPVPAGSYDVAEAPDSGFTTTSSCDNLATPAVETASASGLVVTEGQNWTCRFVNTAKPGTITVVKHSVGADGTFPFTSNIPSRSSFSVTTTGGTGSTAAFTAPVGTYNITESVPAQWNLTGASCTGGDAPSAVNVGPGENVTCTFTDTAPTPSIRVVKTAGVGSLDELGGPVTYTVTVVNTSVEPVTVTELKDSISGGPALDLTANGGPISATTCNALVGTSIPAGGSGSCTFVGQVSGLGNTSVTDVVSAKAKDSDGNVATGSDDASVAIVGVLPTAEITKTPSVPAVTEPGGPVTYTVTVENTGVDPLTIDSLTDKVESDAPLDVAVVGGPITATTCNALIGSTVASGATVSCTFTYLYDGNTIDLPDGFIDDVVTMIGHDDDGSVTATAHAQVALLDAPPAISVTKTASPDTVAETAPGQTRSITYTVTIHNDSPEPETIDSITDSVEGGAPTNVAGTCDDLVGTSIGAGATKTCTFTKAVSGTGGQTVTDVVKVIVTDDEGTNVADDDPATVTFTDVASSLHVTKAPNVASVPENGGPVTYTVTVENTSPTDTVTIGSVTDQVGGGSAFPAGGDCQGLLGDALAPGVAATCTFTLPVSGNAGDVVDDVVTVSGIDDEGGPVADTGAASVAITDLPSSLDVTKTADVASLPEPGGVVTYTVQITNTSAADPITIGSIADVVDGGAPGNVTGTCDDLVGSVLAPSSVATCTFTATVGTHTGDVSADTVTVAGTDDDGKAVSAKGSESVDITDVASKLSVTKEADVASVPEPGAAVTYTVTIANTSAVDTITINSIADAVGGGIPSAVGGTCAALLGTSLAAGESVQCEFVADVLGDAGDLVTDTLTVSGTDDDQQAVSAQGSDSVDVTDVKPSLTVVKTASPTSVPETAPGATTPITYTVDITNDSVEAVTITSITDAVGGGAPGNVAGTCDDLIGTSLAAGASATCTFSATVSGSAGDVVRDVATVSASDDEQNPATASDDARVTFTDVTSSISVTKTAGVDSLPEPGGPVTYTIGITNTSATDAVTIGSIRDLVAGGTDAAAGGTCPDLIGDALAPGASTSCTFTLPVAGVPGDIVNDTVTVTGTDDDGGKVSDHASESVSISDVPSSLKVEKSADVASVTEPGGPVTYTVKVTNTSATDAVTIGTIKDSVSGGAAADAGGTCPDLIGDVLDSGASATCTFTLAVSGEAGDKVTDTVTVTGVDDDETPVSGAGSASVDVTDVKPTITVTKTASPASVAETGPGVTRQVTYTVTIQNDSPETVTIDAMSDAVGGGSATPVAGTCDDLLGTPLASQTGTTCSFTLDVTGNAGATVDDVVTVTASDNERNQAQDSDDATVTFTDLPSSLVVEKTAVTGSVPEPGGSVTYTVKVTNTSEADAISISAITDAVGGGSATDAGGTCAGLVGSSLAPGASATCTFTKSVAGNAGDTVGDTVKVTGVDDDQDPVSADGSETVDITDVASSLLVEKTADVASVPENGGPVTYTVTITNTSPADTITIDTVTDAVGGGAAADPGGTCSALVGTTLIPGASATCTFTKDVAGNAGDVVGDTVTVTGTDDDKGPVSGQGSEVVDITDQTSSLLVEKTADVASVPEPGGNVTYTVTITNTSEADTITIDTIADAAGGGAAADPGGTCSALVGTTLAPKASTSCTFTTAVSGDAGATVGDTVTVTGTDDDKGPVSGQGSETVDITDVLPTGTVTKVADPATVPESGGAVVYTVTVTNTSAAEAATVTAISDQVGADALDVTAVGGPITDTTCALGAILPPGGTYQCHFTYSIAAGTAGDVLSDTIGVTLTDNEKNSTTPTDTETVALTDVAPTLMVVKDNGDASVSAPGGKVDFDVEVTNASFEPVTLTSLTDSVDGGTPFDISKVAGPVLSTSCELGATIAPAGTYSCTFTMRVESDEAATIADDVVATAVDDDETPATAGDGAVTTVTASSDLSVVKRLVSDALVPGETGTYELTVTNNGPSTAMNVTVIDTVPEGLVALNGSGDGWDCTTEGSLVTCKLAKLAPQASSTISVDVGVTKAAAGTEVTNGVDVGSDTDDPDATNNHDEVTTLVADVAPDQVDNTPTNPIEVLVRTGSSPQGMVVLGLALTALGGAVLVARRRRMAGQV